MTEAVIFPALATVLGALVLGLFAVLRGWVRTVSRAAAQLPELLEKLGELAGDVRDLAAAGQETMLLRVQFHAHCREADERWRALGGYIPHPRYATADDRPPAPAGA